MDWKPMAVVEIAKSVDQYQVVVTREDASIEIWNATPSFIGWHYELEILGRDGSVISSLSGVSQSQVPVHLVVYSQLVWMDPFQNGTLVLYSRRRLWRPWEDLSRKWKLSPYKEQEIIGLNVAGIMMMVLMMKME